MKKLIATLPLAIAVSITIGCDRLNSGTCDASVDTTVAASKTADVKKTVHLKVDGMSCGGCVNAIVSKVDAINGVVSCDVSLEGRSATIALSDPAAETTVEEAIRKPGYTVEPEPANPAS